MSSESPGSSGERGSARAVDVRGAQALHVALLLLVGTLWGVQPALIKALTVDLPEIATLGLLLAVMAAILGGYLAARQRLFRPTRSTLAFLAVAGTAEYAFPLVVTFLVAAHVDAGLLTLIMSTTPIFTVALAAATGTERLRTNTVLACVVGIAGIALLVVPENALPSRDMVAWCLAAFAAPISYSLGSVYVSHAWPVGMDVFQVAFGGALVAAILLVPFWIPPLVEGGMMPGSATALWAFAALIMAIVAEMILYFYLIKHAGPVFTSFSSFVMIASGFVAGAALFGERPSLWVWASVALFTLALLMVLSPERRANSGAPGRT